MHDRRVERWAASGAMALTGTPERPLGPPVGLVEELDRLGARLADLDTLALLGERAAIMGLWRRGATSCGGSCRLLPSSDGWMAVSLPRDDDMEAVPAWLELDDTPRSAPAVWSAVSAGLAGRDVNELVERAVLLGLPVARVGEARASSVAAFALGEAPPCRDPLVVDLSSLWAGPLCGDLLARVGARVLKVEATGRPDGARRGPALFFDLLNGRKESVALDFASREGIRTLRRLVAKADVVIESSRPRALEQLGIAAADTVRSGHPRVWVSITGYGRRDDGGRRVAFGDDAAAAGGLVSWLDDEPTFCADALGDPLTGLTAAVACLDALARGGRWLLDMSMARVCAGAVAGPTLAVPADLAVAEPRARRPVRPAPPLGSDTRRIVDELDLPP